MAAPSARMRLTVDVLPLEAENAHGPYRAQAVAAFKGRKFALPVQLEDTFEQVWNQIEQRYKKNYLDAQQAATFTIKKLQDAYDCDLDLGDTVSSIFEGETDPTMRTIKVVPCFVHRDFSVPVTSNLRPAHAQKRLREINAELANKRRRVEQQQPLEDIQEEIDPSRDQPIPTTESERSGDDSAGEGGARGIRPGSRLRRSRTGGSMVIVNGTQTGHAEFGPDIKEESPELGLPLPRKAATATPAETTFKKPSVPVSKKSPRKRQLTRSPSRTPRVPAQAISEQQVADEVLESDDVGVQAVDIQEKTAQYMQDNPALLRLGSQGAALDRSPRPTSEPSQNTPPPAAAKRRDIYDVPSSPEFLHNKSKAKSKKTYGKSPRAARTVQNEVALLNNSRLRSPHAQISSSTQRSITDSISKKARAFQPPRPEGIDAAQQEEEAALALRRGSRAESVQDDADFTAAFLDTARQGPGNATQTPDRITSAKPDRPGSLKKPSRRSNLGTLSSAKRGVQFENTEASAKSPGIREHSDSHNSVASPASPTTSRDKKLDPDIQTRLDKLRQRRRSSPNVVAEQHSGGDSTQSNTSWMSLNGTPAARISDRSAAKPSPQPEKTSIGKAAFVESKINASNDTARLARQPPPARVTPIRSPVPLPENLRRLTPNGTTASAKVNTPNDVEVFKKPDLRLGSMKSNKRANSDSLERHGSGSSDRRSTPLYKIPQLDSNSTTTRAVSPVETVVVISSREPSSTYYSDSEEELQKTAPHPSNEIADQAPAVHKQEGGTALMCKTSSAENDAELPPETDTEADMRALPKTPAAVEEDQEQDPEEDVVVDTKAAQLQLEHPTSADDKRSKKVEPTPWTTESWSFVRLGQPTHAPLPSQSISDGTTEDEAEVDPAPRAGSKSRSASAAISTRSSPIVTRRPARFLSHSPTPKASDSEDESEETSAPASKAALPTPPEGKDEEIESESSLDSEDSDTDDEDAEMPDVPTEPAPDSTANLNEDMPSSPPRLHHLPNSTPLVPETSQPTSSQINPPVVRRTPVLLPPSSQVRSSQSVSAHAAARRPAARYAGFKTLREQLADATTKPAITQTKTYDPRTVNLGKLAAKAKGASNESVGMGNDDGSSEEESSSSSSDSDSD